MPIASEVLPRDVNLADNGHIEAGDEEIQTALYYTGVTFYDLARGSEMDPEMFAQSAAHLQTLVSRYPNEEDSGPTNNWMAPRDAYAKLRAIFEGSMRGRTGSWFSRLPCS